MRSELIEAAKQGVLKMIAESPDSAMHGARVIDTPKGFVVQYQGDNRAYFDVVEM